MKTNIQPRYDASSAGNFNPDEIRRIVQLGKDRGLIRGAGVATPVPKSGGVSAAELGGMRSQWMDVSPGAAKAWLENNFRNRPIKDDVITAYARDMVNGVWMATHQGLAFNDRDELIDGQHRLHAIVRSGKTVRMMVTFGLPSQIDGHAMTTMDCVDRGATRSVADQLTIQHGLKHAGIIAAVARSIAALCSEERTRRLSVGQTLDIFAAYNLEMAFVIDRRAKDHGLKQAGVLAGFAFAIAADDAVKRLYTELLTGEGAAAKKKSALHHLRAFLQSEEAKLLTRGTDRGLTELVLQAIHLEISGETADRLEPSPDGAARFRRAQRDRVEKISAMFELPKAAAK